MPKKKDPDIQSLAGLSTVGLTLVFSTFIGMSGIGLLLDRFLGTRPFLMILFLLLGIIGGFVNIFRTVKKSI